MLNMTPAEIVANFGGQERVARLELMLQRLSAAGTRLMIISLGRTECIAAHLKAVNLLRYFKEEDIYGRDSPDLRKHRCGGLFCKALLILELMARAQWRSDEASFSCFLFLSLRRALSFFLSIKLLFLSPSPSLSECERSKKSARESKRDGARRKEGTRERECESERE